MPQFSGRRYQRRPTGFAQTRTFIGARRSLGLGAAIMLWLTGSPQVPNDPNKCILYSRPLRLQLIQLFLFVPLPAPVLTGDVYEQLPTIMTVKLAPFACECFINFVCTLALEHEKAFITKRLQHADRRNLTTAFWASQGQWLNVTVYIKLQSSL